MEQDVQGPGAAGRAPRHAARSETERGVAAVELALVMPLVAGLLLATLDLAAVAQRASEVHALARAAAAAVQRQDLLPPRPGPAFPLSGTPPGQGPGAGVLPGTNVAPGRAAPGRNVMPGAGSSPPGLVAPGPRSLPGLGDRSALLGQLVRLPEGVAGTLQLFWGCAGGSEPLGTRPTCPGGVPPAPYAEVRLTGEVDRLVAWPGLLLPGRVEARARVRLG